MYFKKVYLIIVSLVLVSCNLFAQVTVGDKYLILNAKTDDPLFTTYAAAMNRSVLYGDKAYFMDYFTPDKAITYSSQYAGDFSVVWKVNNVVVNKVRDFIKKPIVIASFPDMAILEYEPFEGLRVQEVFFVYSSGSAVIEQYIENTGSIKYSFVLYPVLQLSEDTLRIVRFDSVDNSYVFDHNESLIRLHSNLYKDRGYPTELRNILSSNVTLDSYGAANIKNFDDFYFTVKRLSKVHENIKKLNQRQDGFANIVSLQKDIVLNPGEKIKIRFVRSVQDKKKSEADLFADNKSALNANLQQYVDENVQLFKKIPRISFKTQKEKMVYISSFNLVRQCMLPPSGQTKRNFYVFSRNPVWGWGHGHQVMHESLSMIPYAYLDPKSAEESQRVYMDQQYEDGFIAYRHGPRGAQVYPHEGKPTTSAPFFSWTNWEIYGVNKDKSFLKDSYEAGAKYIRYLEIERDQNQDGLFEWGPYGIIENVRDGWNVVFQLFSDGEDEGRDISSELNCLDLSAEVANEIYYLKLMAKELGDTAGIREWTVKYNKLSGLINKYMWDPQDKFYYNVSMADNAFEFEGKSLKRKELIGFLPMWANFAAKQQAADLVKHVADEKSFWRKYGVPSLAANDPNYTPFVDGCCRWNGPVWFLWDYIVYRGLVNYGYKDLAQKLGQKMLNAAITQLEINHHFWESYSPDFPVQESPSNYIWDSILAKLLIDMYGK